MTSWATHGPTEAEYQREVIKHCQLRHIPVFHIPNGGSRNAIEGANLKRQGVMAGVPDLCIPVARGGFHGLYIELKRDKKSTVGKSQRYWQSLLNEQGYLALVCYGADEAISQIDRYVRLVKEGRADEVRSVQGTKQENA